MTLMQLRVFIAVAETGGIRPASDRIGRTPSAISMALKKLEDEIGGALFQGERKAMLSLLGEFMLDHARNLIEHSERVGRTVKAFACDAEGAVEAAVLPSIALVFLPEALKMFMEDRPWHAVHVRDMDSDAIVDAVSREVVDFGVTSHRPVPHLEAKALFSEPLNVVCREDDSLCRECGPIEWAALEGRLFIGNGTVDSVASTAFKAAGLRQQTYIRSALSLLAAVKAGVGVTVLPSLARYGDVSGLRFLPLADIGAKRDVHLVHRSDRSLSPASMRFASALGTLISKRATEFGLQVHAPLQTIEEHVACGIGRE
jgi:DNA-binding transcriptional LysR family regulator